MAVAEAGLVVNARGVLGAAVMIVTVVGTGCKGGTNQPPDASPAMSASAPVDVDAALAAQREAERKVQAEEAFGNVPDEKAWVAAAPANVTGASGLSCEVKAVSGWMRIYCHGKNAKGGMPTDVTVVKKSDDVTKAGLFHSTQDGVALLFTYQTGTHVEAVFAWTDGSRKLTVDWPSTGKPAFKGSFAPFTGDATPVHLDMLGTLDRAPLVPVRVTVEDLIANARAYKGQLVSILGWQNGSVDTYMGMGEGLYPDEENLNDIFFKTSELTPDERKMLIRGACHVVVVGVWGGDMIDTWSVRKTTGAENGAMIQQMIDDEANRLRQKGF
jgi:hypothetical protein